MQINKRIIIPAAIGFLLIIIILFFFLFFRQKQGLSQNLKEANSIQLENTHGSSGIFQQSGLSGSELQNLLLNDQTEADLLAEQGLQNLSQSEIELQLSMQREEAGRFYSQSGAIEINPNAPPPIISSLNNDVFLIFNSSDENTIIANQSAAAANSAIAANAAAAVNVAPAPVIIPIPDYMVLVRSGTFEMGSPETEIEREEDEQLHSVIIRPFYISKYEVTQHLYEEVMGNNPSYFKGANLPVDNVSWFDAILYCNVLSVRDGLSPAYTIHGNGENRIVIWNRDSLGYRLPTEAEWEFACRAGTATAYNTGENINRSRANYMGRGTRNVGNYPPNNWGLYDMHGNVSEWCWDWYYDYSMGQSSDSNYSHKDEHRIFRGGSWFSSSIRLRSAFREHYYSSYRSMSIGFRIARNYE